MVANMLIQFERTGGFAGMRKKFTVDTDSLPPEEATRLHKMIETAGFFNLPSKSKGPSRGADQFQYRLIVETEKKKHTVELGEASVPATLRPLLKSLMTYEKQ